MRGRRSARRRTATPSRTPRDDWVTSYEAFVQGSSRTPRLAHVLQSPGSAVRLASLNFVNGDDTPTWSYNLTVPAGGTVTVLNFVAGLGSRADAALKGAQLAALPPWARVCMTSTESSSLANMVTGPLPTGPAPTGPAGMTITSPTTETTFNASGPFIAIGGVAGPANLTGVTWSSNRGFSGTVQGASEWTIPAAALLPGNNVITVTAQYEGGAPITDTITIVRGALTYLLPEGSTGAFFTTDVSDRQSEHHRGRSRRQVPDEQRRNGVDADPDPGAAASASRFRSTPSPAWRTPARCRRW